MHISPYVHGVLRRADLPDMGIATESQLHKAIRNGTLTRIGYNWYAVDNADPAVVTAIRLGARIGCLSACKYYRIWVERDAGLHLEISKSRTQPILFDKFVESRHISAAYGKVYTHRVQRLSPYPICSFDEAMGHALRCHDRETCFIALKSAINQGIMSLSDARAALTHRGIKKAALSRYLSASSESGSESRVRLFFLLRKVKVEAQVHIEDVGRVDLLVGNSLIVECDSAAHHSQYDRYRNDRRRDLAALALGYHVIRLSYEQIWDTWDETQKVLSNTLKARIHHRLTRVPAASRR